MEKSQSPIASEDNSLASIQNLLDAIESLGDELASRDEKDVTFRVSVPHDPPAIRILAELINGIGDSVDQHLADGEKEMLRRTNELTQAYNAMQDKNEEMRKELEMARRIQEQLLPQAHDLPNRPEISCAGYYSAMSNVGGDLYDIIRVGRNSYALLIADVSGHGVPAALITALVKIAFRSRANWGVNPAEVCRQVNLELTPILGDLDYFVTVWFGIVDLETGKLRYTNAGHDPALWLRTDGSIIELDSGGRFLGQFDDATFKFQEVQLEPEDMLLLYTDGIVEARNMLDEEYGFERLRQCLLQESFGTAAELVSIVRRDLDSFCIGNPQRDDLSMFALDFQSLYVPRDEAKPDSENPAGLSKTNLAKLRLARELGKEAAILIRANQRAQAKAVLESGLVLVPGEALVSLRLSALHIMEKNWDQAGSVLGTIINPNKLPEQLHRQYERLRQMVLARRV